MFTTLHDLGWAWLDLQVLCLQLALGAGLLLGSRRPFLLPALAPVLVLASIGLSIGFQRAYHANRPRLNAEQTRCLASCGCPPPTDDLRARCPLTGWCEQTCHVTVPEEDQLSMVSLLDLIAPVVAGVGIVLRVSIDLTLEANARRRRRKRPTPAPAAGGRVGRS